MLVFPSDVRIISIASTLAGAERIVAAAAMIGNVPIGLMLRDPEHDEVKVRGLGAGMASRPLPPNVFLGGNAFLLPNATFLHLPYSMIAHVPTSVRSIPIGLSVHSTREAEHAVSMNPSYLIASPVFPTPSKPGHPGIGLDGLNGIVNVCSAPVYALGGITEDRVSSVIEAGAHGVASVGLFAATVADVAARLLAVSGLIELGHEQRGGGQVAKAGRGGA